MTGIGQDLRYALRTLRHSPGFAAVAVLTLALGVGANVTVFSAVDALLFRPPPVEEPDRLVRLHMNYDGGFRYGSLSYPDYVDQRDRSEAFSALALHRPIPLAVRAGERSERTWGQVVSANYFDALGVPPALGRTFRPEEAASPGEPAIAVLAHDYWRGRFGGDPGVVGRTITINGHPFTVVGVAPRGFHGVQKGLRIALWVPATMQAQVMPGGNMLEARGNRSFMVTGRLREGVTLEQARERTAALLSALDDEYGGAYDGMRITVMPETDVGLGARFAGTAGAGGTLLLVVVGLLLLIACVNVANLLLARAATRRREIGIRVAVGAGRGRLVRQLLTESVVLAGAAGAVGVGIAHLAAGALASVQLPVDLPLLFDFRIDGRVLAYTVAVSGLTAVLFGLVPALQGSRPDVMTALRGGVDASAARASRTGRVLVAGQVGLSAVILVAVGLFVRSLQEMRTVDPGFDGDRHLMVSVDPGLVGYDAERGRVFYRELLDRVRALHGVRRAGLGEIVPFSFAGQQWGIDGVDGYEAGPDENMIIDYNVVAPGYFETIGVPLLRGRDFRASDDADARPVMIVSRAMAERFWPDGEAVGGTVRLGDSDVEVVGVLADMRVGSLREEPAPVFYLPLGLRWAGAMTLHIRTAGEPLAFAPEVRAAVRELDAEVPVFGVRSMADQIGVALFPARAATWMLGVFGLLGLVLAVVGLYGVMAYAVRRRTREIGLRLALGAAPEDLLRGVMRQAARLALIGLGTGLLAAFGLTRLMGGLLYAVDPGDPLTFGVVAIVLGTVAVAAAYAPARRAARVDPMTALRTE